MSSGCVVGTISIDDLRALLLLEGRQLGFERLRWAASSVPVWSMTRAVSARHRQHVLRRRAGAAPAPAESAQAAPAMRTRHRHAGGAYFFGVPKSTVGGVEICASFCTVKFGLGRVAEHHGRQVGREAARQHVVLLHRLDVAVARHGDAVLGAFELHAQVAEGLVGLQVRVLLGHHHQAATARSTARPAPAGTC